MPTFVKMLKADRILSSQPERIFMKKMLIGVALASGLTCVYAEDAPPSKDDQAISKNQKNVCLYAGLTYSEGAYIQVGKTTQVCTKPGMILHDVPTLLVWKPINELPIKTPEKK